MKLAVCLVVVLVSMVQAVPAGTYNTKYDNINLDEVIRNDRLFNSYFNCLMDKGKCTPDGEQLKRSIPDALQTACQKCSRRQREGTEKMIKYMIQKRSKQFEALERKYDPKKVFRTRYQAEAAKRGIRLPH